MLDGLLTVFHTERAQASGAPCGGSAGRDNCSSGKASHNPTWSLRLEPGLQPGAHRWPCQIGLAQAAQLPRLHQQHMLGAQEGVSNLQNDLEALCDQDKSMIASLAKEFELDYVSLSFARAAEDVEAARDFLDSLGLTHTKAGPLLLQGLQ